jgi:hypothetical protein
VKYSYNRIYTIMASAQYLLHGSFGGMDAPVSPRHEDERPYHTSSKSATDYNGMLEASANS